jgi:hypothetical protein
MRDLNSQWTAVSVVAVIGVSFEDGESAIELLKQHNPGEFVGQGNLSERQDGAGLASRCIAPAIGGAYGK